MSIDLPEKQQLDLILESSEDLIMIDSGPEKIIQYIKEHPNLTKEEYFNNIPEKHWPVITYCSPSWTKFNYLENEFDLDETVKCVKKLLRHLHLILMEFTRLNGMFNLSKLI